MMKIRNALSALCLSLLPALHTAAQVSPERQLADDFIRSGVAFIGYSQAIESDAPFVLSGTLLDAALELNPDNAQAWALRAELAQAAGDLDAYEAALAGYLETGIEDDRARFNLIRYRLSKNATLDAQLSGLEQLLNSDAGRALSPQLRSRLAGMAAAAAGELVDKPAQRRWAVEAARSDPANTDAAQMMLELVVELGGDTVRQGTATVNIIRANPLDPWPRIQLAGLLAQEAAFERAAQQYQVVATRLSRQPMPLPAYVSWAQSLSVTGQEVLALQLIDELEKAFAGMVPAAPTDQGDPDRDEPGANADTDTDAAPAQPVDPVALPIELELVRLSVLDGEDDAAAAQATFDRIAERLNSAEPRGDEADQPDAAERSNQASLALVAAVFGPDMDQAQALANAVADDADSQSLALGWIALRRGAAAEAAERLRPLADNEPLAACGLALIDGQDDNSRGRLLSAVIQRSPGSLAALAAGRRLSALGIRPKPTDVGKTLTDLMGRSPESFWQVDVERTPWLEVRLKIEPQRIAPLQPITAQITVWNTTRFPLAIGENGPIRSQAMVLITATSSGLPLPPSAPIVIDLGRKFSLDAGERMVFDARLDYHQFGNLRATNPGAPLVFDARLLVNPTMTPGGTWLAGPVGGIANVRNCLVQSRPATQADVEQWLTNLDSNDPGAKLIAMSRLAGLSSQTDEELARPALLERVGNALANTWDKSSDAERAWIIMNARQLAEESTSYPELLTRATQSDSRLIWLALLSRQVADGESPILRTAIGRQDMPDISRFAERQRRLLRAYQDIVREQQRLREEQQRLQGTGAGFNNPGQP